LELNADIELSCYRKALALITVTFNRREVISNPRFIAHSDSRFNLPPSCG